MGHINPAILTLEDGSTYLGKSFGAPAEISGEVVFNTGMVGYPEALTDPSYKGQILISTYPLVGNYGVHNPIKDEFGIPVGFQSSKIQVSGFGIHKLSKEPSHWTKKMTLNEWLLKENKPGIEGIDTRSITKKLRVKGVMLGVLKIFNDGEKIDLDYCKDKVKKIDDPNKRNLSGEASTKQPVKFEKNNSKNVVVIDCGVKLDIIRNLVRRNVNVNLVPHDYSAEKILSYEPSGILISNGPGDPQKCEKTIKAVSEIFETDIPVFGICQGLHILNLASGGDTYKLKFGHRGQNHPCMDLKTKRCFITSQNHGYATCGKSLGKNFEVSLVNLNDDTVEGIEHKKKNIFGIQFHPEASPGPVETNFFFDKFIERVKKYEN